MRNQLSYLPDEENPDYGRPPWAAAVGMDMPGIAGQPQQDMPPPAAEPRLQLRRPEMLDTAPPDVGPMPDAAPADSGETQGNSASPWAVVADLLLNKGRGLGPILALGAAGRGQDRDLERRYKEAQIQHLTNPQYANRNGLTPEQRDRMLEQADERIKNAMNGQAGVQGRYEDLRNRVDDPTSQHNMTQVSQAGARSGATARGRIEAESELSGTSADTAGERAGAVSDAQQGNKIQIANIQAGNAADRTRAEREDRQYARDQEFGSKFAEKHNNDMALIGAIDELNATPGGAAPQGLAERLGVASSLFARGVDPDRMPAVALKRAILEKFSRVQSGAAINHPEEAKFIQQVGANPLASDAEVDSALKILHTFSRDSIRGGAAMNRGAAETVLGARGLDPEAVLGPQYKRPATPAAAPASSPEPSSVVGEVPQVSGIPAGDTLRTVGGSAPANPAGGSRADAQQERRERRVTKPSGQVVMYPLSDEEAAKLGSRRGWKVE